MVQGICCALFLMGYSILVRGFVSPPTIQRNHHLQHAQFTNAHFFKSPIYHLRSRKGYRVLTSTATADEDSGGEDDVKGLKKKLTRQFLEIGAPAFIQLAAEPLAALVDTAYLGRLGPDVLGGAGVAISAQYSVSKLYNDPLLRTR